MASFADRVKETTTSTGTATVNLGGAATGYQTFVAGVGTGATVFYCIVGGAEWEVGSGTVTDASPDTLSRDTVLASSTGSKVSFSAGSKNVMLVAPASIYRTGAGSTGVGPDGPPLIADVADDEFDGAALDTGGTRRSGATAWAWNNQGSGPTATLTNGVLYLKAPAQGGGNNWRSILQSAPSGAWKYRAKISVVSQDESANHFGGVCVRHSADGHFTFLGVNTGGYLPIIQRWNSTTSWNTNDYLNSVSIDRHHKWFYVEVERDATPNIIWRWSEHGFGDYGWSNGMTVAEATWPGTVDGIGLCVNNTTASADTTLLCEWFRRVA